MGRTLSIRLVNRRARLLVVSIVVALILLLKHCMRFLWVVVIRVCYRRFRGRRGIGLKSRFELKVA